MYTLYIINNYIINDACQLKACDSKHAYVLCSVCPYTHPCNLISVIIGTCKVTIGKMLKINENQHVRHEEKQSKIIKKYTFTAANCYHLINLKYKLNIHLKYKFEYQ